MRSETGQFYLWRILPNGELIKAAAFGVEQAENQRLLGVDFAYLSGYLSHPGAIALDPLYAPLKSGEMHFETHGRDLPGFLDDNIPDAWGRRVVAMRLNQRHVDTLTLLNNCQGASLGDLLITPVTAAEPVIEPSVPFCKAQEIADAVWEGDLESLARAPASLKLLLSGGSRPGGARPKLLVNHEGQEWIAKFNHSGDRFDVAAEEWASMRLARLAGLPTPEVRLEMLGQRRCLLVKRFDVSGEGGRYHMLTLNALLKNPYTQEDPHVGRYEDIAELLRRYSADPEPCLKQLLGQLLLNAVLHNTDDHLRNFSLINKGHGWSLSPVYDLLPSEVLLGENQLSLGGSFYLPKLEEAVQAAKTLGLSDQLGRDVKAQLVEALKSWPALLKEAGVSGDRYTALSKLGVKQVPLARP